LFVTPQLSLLYAGLQKANQTRHIWRADVGYVPAAKRAGQ
jgi:hypothetical protein